MEEENKTYYLYVKGQKVEVSEEIYRSYVRPERRIKVQEYRRKVKSRVSSIEMLAESGIEIADGQQDFLDAIIETEEETERKTRLLKAISSLNEREGQIVQMYFYESKTQDEIAEIFDVSRQYISKKIKQILEKLKKFF